eukprot:scaffold242621_cov30-Tisochrysis_lutea.AAC.2
MRTVRLRDVLTGIAGPRFEVNAPEILIIDNRIVRLLVLEVVSNAMKHSRRGSPIKVAADFIGIEPVHGEVPRARASEESASASHIEPLGAAITHYLEPHKHTPRPRLPPLPPSPR